MTGRTADDGTAAGASGGRTAATVADGGAAAGDAAVVYYSRTGTTRALAGAVADCLDDPAVHRIRPRRERSYWNWLARSFVPGSTVAIEPVDVDPRAASALFLGTPKWTLSCPPVTEFVRRAALDGVPVGLFVTYGGFDERRYATALADRLGSAGAEVRGKLLVQRDDVEAGAADDRVGAFCRRVLGAAGE